MFRLIRLLVFVLAGIVAVARVASERGMTVDWGWVFVGLLIAAVAGLLDMQISNWWSTVTQPYKPQMVKMPTKETPAQITGSATTARLIGAFVLTLLIAGAMGWFDLNIANIPIEVWSVLIAVFAIAFIAPMFVARRSAG